MRRRPARRWDEHTADEVRELVDLDPVVVLPLAAVEQHGPHLPLATDVVLGRGVLDAALAALPDGFPVATLPLQAVGASDEHGDFPGTLSLEAATLEAFIRDVGASLSRSGVRRLVVSNSHGGNRAVVDVAGLGLRRAFGMLVVKAHYLAFPRPEGVDLPESEWIHGLHGGAVETSMMLHLRPDLVRSDRIRRFGSLGEELEEELTHVGPEAVAPFSWSAGDLSPEGATGDASLADAPMGRRLVAHYGRCLAQVVEDARRFPLERLSPGGR